MGLGGASVVLDNIYGSYNNQATLAHIEQLTLATSFSSRFSLSDARVMAAIPFSYGVIGFNISRFGSESYGEYKVGLSYSRSFGDLFSAALQADVLSVMQSLQGDVLYAFTGEASLWMHPIPELTLGFHLYNFLQAEYPTLFYDESIPVNMKLGLGYTVFDNFLLTGEIENSSLYGTCLRGGLAYTLYEGVVLRTGGASHPTLASIGLGVKWSGLSIDIAAQAVRSIGKTGGVSLSYSF